MFNIGDTVTIIDDGLQYTTFTHLYKDLTKDIKNCKPYTYGVGLKRGKHGIIKNIIRHHCLIEADGFSYIFAEDGLFKQRPFVVGDIVEADNDIYEITNNTNKWVGVVTSVFGDCFSAKTISYINGACIPNVNWTSLMCERFKIKAPMPVNEIKIKKEEINIFDIFDK